MELNPYMILSRVLKYLDRKHQLLGERFDLLREARDKVNYPDPILDYLISEYENEIMEKQGAGKLIGKIARNNFEWWDNTTPFYVGKAELINFPKNQEPLSKPKPVKLFLVGKEE